MRCQHHVIHAEQGIVRIRRFLLQHVDASEKTLESYEAQLKLGRRTLLDTLNAVLSSPLSRNDIEGVYAGLRPLLHGESDATSELTRNHAVSQSVSGLITVAGGK